MTSKAPVGAISIVTLIRTDTTLDHSQKAEKVCTSMRAELATSLGCVKERAHRLLPHSDQRTARTKKRGTPDPCSAPRERECPIHVTLENHARARPSGKLKKAGGTLRSSRAVPHPSTNRALRRLTSEFGRDPVHSTRYGRWRQLYHLVVNMHCGCVWVCLLVCVHSRVVHSKAGAHVLGSTR